LIAIYVKAQHKKFVPTASNRYAISALAAQSKASIFALTVKICLRPLKKIRFIITIEKNIMFRKIYTREKLIEICESAFVQQTNWRNRDSASAQIQLGQAFALLKAGCDFDIKYTKEKTGCHTNEETIWIQFYVHDFSYFEYQMNEDPEYRGSDSNDYHFYLPTRQRLDEVKGADWY